MNQISKSMIAKGFECGAISIEESWPSCCDGICCRIGEYAFYFIGMEDENLPINEYWKSYPLSRTIDMLHDILKNRESAARNGIYSDEWEYYRSFLVESGCFYLKKVEGEKLCHENS